MNHLPEEVAERVRRGAAVSGPYHAKWEVIIYDPHGWPSTFTFWTREEARQFRRELRALGNGALNEQEGSWPQEHAREAYEENKPAIAARRFRIIQGGKR